MCEVQHIFSDLCQLMTYFPVLIPYSSSQSSDYHIYPCPTIWHGVSLIYLSHALPTLNIGSMYTKSIMESSKNTYWANVWRWMWYINLYQIFQYNHFFNGGYIWELETLIPDDISTQRNIIALHVDHISSLGIHTRIYQY